MQIKRHVHTRQTKILKLNSLFLNHNIKLLTSFILDKNFKTIPAFNSNNLIDQGFFFFTHSYRSLWKPVYYTIKTA
jgi:hypothetical protein